MFPPLSQIAVRVRPLELSDSLGKAAERIRASGGRGAPVTVSGHVVAVLTAEDVAAPLLADPERARQQPVATVELRGVPAVPDFWTAERALAHLRAEGLEAAPVLDAAGRYVGMVSAADLATALAGRLQPRSIGGMATPFGVYLTDGNVRGGVSNSALVWTGVFMGVLMVIATLAAAFLMDRIVSLGGPRLIGGEGALINRDWIETALALLLFMSLFRLSRVSGYHAAEHQTVHAIEAGDDLIPEVVREKPRVHPRCGTNLVVGLAIITLLWNCDWLRKAELFGLGPLIAVVFFLFTWRRVGSAAQQYLTTRPATDAEIRSGIRAGEELLRKFQLSGDRRQTRLGRLRNMGLGHVLLGFGIVLLVAQCVEWLFPGTGLGIGW